MAKAWTTEEWDYVKQVMLTKTYHQIAEELGRTEKSIRRKIQKYGLKKREPIEGHNHDYFKTWSASMSWLLGFIMSDGYVNYRPNLRYTLQFLIHEKDREILEFIRSEISPQSKIHIQTYKNRDNIHVGLNVNSKTMIYDLIGLGFQREKTGNEFLPPIPKQYHWDFIRGVFEGDGCIHVAQAWHTQMLKYYLRCNIFICCSNQQFLIDLREQFGENLGRLSRHVSGLYQWNVDRQADIKTMYERMYYSGHPFSLKRKREKFEEYIRAKGL